MNALAITIDIDWAADFMIDAAAERLLAAGVCCTWLATHPSPAVERLRCEERFEVGIHPNFHPGSTQGQRWDEVLDYCLQAVPDAKTMRTHDLVQSSRLLREVITHTPVERDLSLFLPEAEALTPVRYHDEGGSLLRLPYVWEDDHEMFRPAPRWRWDDQREAAGGLRIFNFHPVHIFLNSPDMRAYEAWKRRPVSSDSVDTCDARRFVHDGEGTGTFFAELVDRLSGRNSYRAADLAAAWTEQVAIP